MESEVIDGALKTAQGISDFGMMAVTAALFLVISGGMMIFCFRWFMKTVDNIMKNNGEMLSRLDEQMKENNEIMKRIAEGLNPETLLRVKTTSGLAFDLANFLLCEIIEKVKTENHISDKEATEAKIKKLVDNLHNNMNSKFDYYTFRGRKLSTYTNPVWVEWMSQGAMNEVYSDYNADRMATNITAIFDRIKLDFYHRMNDM